MFPLTLPTLIFSANPKVFITVLPSSHFSIHIEHTFCICPFLVAFFYTHWTYILYMPIFSRIFLSNYWWQKFDILSQASYRYPISWEAFFDPSDSYFLFAEERGYHKWALAHSSSGLPRLYRIQNVCSMCIEKCDEGKTVYPKSLSNLSTLYFSRMLVETQVPYFTDYRSIGRIAAFRLNFLGNTKIGRSIP
jgi:hypothetical protein